MLVVSSVNVNGIRAAAHKGFTAWLSTASATVVCLQEVRARAAQLPPDVRGVLDGADGRGGWHLAVAEAGAGPQGRRRAHPRPG